MIHLERRRAASRFWTLAVPVVAVLATMLAGAGLFAALGKPPAEALRMIFWDPLLGPNAEYFRGQLLVKAGPLILIACGLAVGFRAGIWNIGAEGQYIVGALSGAAVALALWPAESPLIFPTMVLAGALGGWAWAMIPAFLKTRFGTSEILVSLMLVYVAQNLLAYMAFGPMKNPQGFGFPGSRNLQQYPSAHNAELIAGSGLHWGVVAALLAVIGTHLLMSRHLLGFRIRVAGEAPRAARFAGVSPARLIRFCLGLSGALAGVAGMFEVAGPSGQITDSFNANYGFTAIIVAFLGRLNPWGILAAGLLMALTYIGGDLAQLMLGLPAAAIQAFQGMLLFFLLAFDLLTQYRIRWKGART
ncbi:ABC transporter permease [Phaeovulum vinaykumarii]|uniref:Nucleoside ABC transporter membrane protein n=1 Tax=Phaeovulum vinaykumarii TaxID=407234 RepID=A0A1N7LG94_9RHOB|nr:ABC transporter permease [Phaeovulum vinaykumarii]SIS72850.1 nucleoside ABC transporter membrane protein [Phaeovulum vinaykumarii]SOC04536.1 nucleoside ABC transporter membrane protein [Phaeovulum vinaykumarii]